MLLHFKLNCFIFVMLVGQINLGEKVSRNIDAFFDPSVDNLQDNFYDVPFIPEKQNDDQITEYEIFQFGRDKLLDDRLEHFNDDFEEIHRLYELKNEIIKRDVDENDDCGQSHNSTLLESVVNKFNQIGKERNNLHLRMQDIEDDQAILEGKGGNYLKKRIKRNILEDVPTPNRHRRHKFFNAIQFSHKYRHKRPQISFDYDALQIDKRMSNKQPKIPHKHRSMNIPFHSSKHEEFKADLSDAEECYVKPSEADESGCNATKKHKQEPKAESVTTKKTHKQLAAKETKSTTIKETKESCNKTKPTRTDVTKHQIEPLTKPSIPQAKPSIKSVLCHKNSKSSTTKSQLDEYEDYKAGDYIETDRNLEFRVKRNKLEKSNCDKNEEEDDGDDHENVTDKDLIDEFLKGETTKTNKERLFQAPDTSTKSHKEDAIEQFLKGETTKSEPIKNTADPRRHIYDVEEQLEASSEEQKTPEEEKKNSVSKIDQFINGEVPTGIGTPLKKHKQLIKINSKKVKNKNDVVLKRTAYLTPIFNKERIHRKKLKELLNDNYFTTEKMTPDGISNQFYSSEETPEDASENPEQQIYVLKSMKDEGDETKKFKQRIFIVKPKKEHNQNFENGKKFVVHDPENSKPSQHFGNNNNNNNMEQSPEKQIITYLKQIIKNQKQNINRNKQKENVVNINEMNRKLGHEDPITLKPVHESEKKPNPNIYVTHLRNQGRQHHRIYFEPEQRKQKQKQKIGVSSSKTFARKFTRNSSETSPNVTLNKYEKFLERLENKDIFTKNDDEPTTKKVKHQTESDPDPDLEDDDEETIETPEPETSPEIDELYNEIPVNKKRIQLSLNCDSDDYKNRNHCICSVKTMLRDLMDDLKDINTSMNYQYDCSKYIGIEPGIVIANDSRRRREKRHIFGDNFMLRKGSRIGRDVDGLLNQHLNVDDSDNYIYATLGSKVVMHCGNASSDYNEDDKIVWTIRQGAPETAGVKEDNGRELIIERVSAQDTNNYTCAISHKLPDGSYGPTKKFLHKLSIVEIPIYSLMITVIFNESTKCEQEDLETLHNYYPLMLKKFLCQGAEQICQVSVDKPHCTRSQSENGVTMHATLKTLPLYTILPTLKKKQETCGLNCQSRVYSIIVKTLQNNFASVTNLPGIIKSIKNSSPYSLKSVINQICFPIQF